MRHWINKTARGIYISSAFVAIHLAQQSSSNGLTILRYQWPQTMLPQMPSNHPGRSQCLCVLNNRYNLFSHDLGRLCYYLKKPKNATLCRMPTLSAKAAELAFNERVIKASTLQERRIRMKYANRTTNRMYASKYVSQPFLAVVYIMFARPENCCVCEPMHKYETMLTPTSERSCSFS